MTDNFDDEEDKRFRKFMAERHRRPPVERLSNGRYRPGHSGNPRGRTPKRERAYLPGQLTRDVFGVTEELIAIKTSKGVELKPAIEVALLRVRNKAVEGHGPSLRLLVALHRDGLRYHRERYKFMKRFEELEYNVLLHGDSIDASIINDMRKQTRKT